MKLINYIGKTEPALAQSLDEAKFRDILFLILSIPVIVFLVIIVFGFILLYYCGFDARILF